MDFKIFYISKALNKMFIKILNYVNNVINAGCNRSLTGNTVNTVTLKNI